MPIERNPCVYILASGRYGTLYIGVMSDLPKRLWQHRHGTSGGFTTRHNVQRLVYFEQFGDMDRAIAREKQLKNWGATGRSISSTAPIRIGPIWR